MAELNLSRSIFLSTYTWKRIFFSVDYYIIIKMYLELMVFSSIELQIR